jgi:hypothetical protein
MQFLLEAASKPDLQKIADIISRDCQPWLKQAKGNLAYRGVDVFGNSFLKQIDVGAYDTMFKGAVRTNREPKDSPLWLHNALNKYFTSKVGIPVRSNCLFIAGNFALASNYGLVYAVFPIGDINYTWSKYVADPTDTFWIGPSSTGELPPAGPGLNSKIYAQFKEYAKMNNLRTNDIQTLLDPYADVYTESQSEKIWSDFCDKFINENDLWTFNSGLKSALTKYDEHEIMVVCDQYYLVHYRIAQNLIANDMIK